METAYPALLKAIRTRVDENKASREIHDFVKALPERECRNFVEDALTHFQDCDNSCDYGNVMARTLHMYGYEIYERLKGWN